MRGTFWDPGWVVGTCLAQNLSQVLGAPEAAGTVSRWEGYLLGVKELFTGLARPVVVVGRRWVGFWSPRGVGWLGRGRALVQCGSWGEVNCWEGGGKGGKGGGV